MPDESPTNSQVLDWIQDIMTTGCGTCSYQLQGGMYYRVGGGSCINGCTCPATLGLFQIFLMAANNPELILFYSSGKANYVTVSCSMPAARGHCREMRNAEPIPITNPPIAQPSDKPARGKKA